MFHRKDEDAAAPPVDAPPPEDTVPGLLQLLDQLLGFIRLNSGRLPVESVVAALRVTDTLRGALASLADKPLNIHAAVSINGIVSDYLPTTLRSYLALDPSVLEVPRPSGRSPRQSLIEQVDSLSAAAEDVVDAMRSESADALLSQGTFLRTKFSRSDLDL